MGQQLDKLKPFCFNLHGSYTVPEFTKTNILFGVGFELFGNFDKTNVDPRKSVLNIDLVPQGKGVPTLKNGAWDTDEKAYKCA